MSATELAVDATMDDKAGIPRGRAGSLSAGPIGRRESLTAGRRSERNHPTPPTLFQEAAELQLAVPLPKLARQILVIPLQDVAFIAEILDDGAVSESSTRRRVADVAAVLRLVWRLTHWWREEKEVVLTFIQSTDVLIWLQQRTHCGNLF